jgi:hypothetical protein
MAASFDTPPSLERIAGNLGTPNKRTTKEAE